MSAGDAQYQSLPPGVARCLNEKFDIQLSNALIAERQLAEMLAFGNFAKLELKTESHLWEKTGNVCIEYKHDDKPSGIAVTEADFWVHDLRRDGSTLLYLVVPMERMKELTRAAIKRGDFRRGAGDGGRQTVALLKLTDLLR